MVEFTPHTARNSVFQRTAPSLKVPCCLLWTTCCSQMQRKNSSIPIDFPSLVQHSAIKDIVLQSVHSTFHTTHTNSDFSLMPSNQTLAALGMASPSDLLRPVDQNLKVKILWGEYINFTLLLPNNVCQSHTPEIHLCLDDLSSGPMDSPVTMVRKRKPVIDSLEKWLEVYMVYMLVTVTAHPRGALELVKYQQIISKGTVTFSGLAKTHCSICASPYHTEDVCPSADRNRKHCAQDAIAKTAATYPRATPVAQPGTQELQDLVSMGGSKVEQISTWKDTIFTRVCS